MAITPTKTWEIISRPVYGANTTGPDDQNVQVLWNIKDALTLGTNPWVVKASCGKNGTGSLVSGPTPLSITNATQANPCVLTMADTSALATGERIRVSNVSGMTELNGNEYSITVLTGTTLSLQDVDGGDVDSTAYTAYTSGGDIDYQDSVDRWVTYEDLVWSTGNSSWIVLEQSSISASGRFQILIDCDFASTSTENLKMWVSPSGSFLGGSVSAPPTADDQISILSGLWANSTEYPVRATFICRSTDGECTRIFGSYNRIPFNTWMFEKATATDTAWTDPWITFVQRGTDSPTGAAFYGASNFTVNPPGESAAAQNVEAMSVVLDTNVLCYTSGEGLDDRDFEGEYVAYPVYLNFPSVSQANNRPLGKLQDIWSISQSLQKGQYLEGCGGAWEVVAMGNTIAQPWDGSTPVKW